VKRVICSGEALSARVQEACFRQLGSELHNLYGPTEAAVDVTHWTCQRQHGGTSVPIGRPVANTQIYILDRHRQPVPIGVSGELYIGGVQVGRGYLNRPELTADRFVPDPFRTQPDARLYRTGDLARFRADGVVEFEGRNDGQVKLRGFRIELGEIESVLAMQEGVANVAVVLREDSPGDQRLVAYLVLGQERAPMDQLRRAVSERLPGFMIPSSFVVMDALPLTPSGKLDRRALPVPEAGNETRVPYLAPRNPTESALAEIWGRVLQVNRVGVRDNFFDLGGHSLLATQVVSRVRQELQVEMPLRRFFHSPTVEGLALVVIEEQASLTDDATLTRLLSEVEQGR
jgi:acyl-coenzyme A synthetase/AMP-(fatty) acid ligase/acyl carrier protein